MAFGSFEKGEEIEANAEINMVPFIDVMLVLLIIFMITAPLMTHAVKVELPKASVQPLLSPGKPLEVAISADGTVHLDGRVMTLPALQAAFRTYRADTSVQLRADRNARYDTVAQVLAAAAEAGLASVGFVADPAP